MLFLRQGTAVSVHLGPLVDATDGFTPEAAVTFGPGELDLFKAGAAAAVDISSRSVSHLAKGVYQLDLLPTDTDTLGPLAVCASDSAHRPLRLQANVLTVNAFDTFMGGDRLFVDVKEIDSSNQAAINLQGGTLATARFQVLAGSDATRVVTNLTEAQNDHFNGRSIVFLTGALQGQAAAILDYNGASKELTVSALTSAPANGDTGIIV